MKSNELTILIGDFCLLKDNFNFFSYQTINKILLFNNTELFIPGLVLLRVRKKQIEAFKL